MNRRQTRALNLAVGVAGVVLSTMVAACGSSDSDPASTDTVADPDGSAVGRDVPQGDRPCILDLHGKGGDGRPTVETDGIVTVAPSGNGQGWGGREWRYSSDDELREAIRIATAALDNAGCANVAVHGFSNGAAFITRALCEGETFNGRLVGVVVDDPVPDTSARDCGRPADVPIALYWTGGLDDAARPGVRCSEIDWTCRDGVLVGIDSFAADLGTQILQSTETEHRRHDAAPEPLRWLRDG